MTDTSLAPRAVRIQAALADRWAAFLTEFMRLTWIRVLVAVLFVAFVSQITAIKTRTYYSSFVMPPSYRHTDATAFREIISDYLDAQAADQNTLLVLGDCVAFGHGVRNSFSAYLHPSGLRVVNISMQSFRYDLMVSTVEMAARRGVKHVLVQVHPFEDYGFEAKQWEQLASLHPASAQITHSLASPDARIDFPAQAVENWRIYAAGLKSKRASFHDVPPYDWRTVLTMFLRVDILSHFALWRDRFAVDDWSGLNLSTYTRNTHRSDSFVERLPEARQIEILKDMGWLWPKFVINDPAQYREQSRRYSAPVRLAQTLKDLDMDAVFFIAPTLVDMLSANTVIKRSDLTFVSDVMKENVTRFGFRYLDYLDRAELQQHLIHYDNLTATGQRLLGNLLNSDLYDGHTQAAQTESRLQ